MNSDARIIIVLPAYNAAKTLEKTYADIPKEKIFKRILVDDVSQDQTVEIARALGKSAGAVKQLQHRACETLRAQASKDARQKAGGRHG